MQTDIIQAKDLHFTYPDGTAALQNINFSVKKGEFVGILGANGSGKTTFLKMLNRLCKPRKGKVYFESKDIFSINSDTLFKRVCTMFQNPDDQLFAPTVAEDIAFGPANMGLSEDQIKKIVVSALEAVEISEIADKAIHNLSFGQKKRVCLAGVLAMEPEVMLLDEPTFCLDPMGVNSIMYLLKKLNKQKGITMIMATHSIDLVPLFIDRVVILDKGRVILEGLPEEVFSRPEIIRLAKLRLPRIGHLFEILNKKDGLNLEHLPLTIGEARRELKSLLIK
jgi:cobalt/nickel transport system ATP-binding protein